jgi:hypothetical protein
MKKLQGQFKWQVETLMCHNGSWGLKFPQGHKLLQLNGALVQD